MKKPKQKYWYRIHIGECPVCGRNQGWRERVYGKRPKDTEKRYVQLSQNETYDHCFG